MEKKYYADGEDAFDMRKALGPKKSGGRVVSRQTKPATKPPPPPTAVPALPAAPAAATTLQPGASEVEGNECAPAVPPPARADSATEAVESSKEVKIRQLFQLVVERCDMCQRDASLWSDQC